MGINVSNLKPSPALIRQGITQVSLNFYAVVDGASDNPVQLKLYIDPLQPVFYIEGSNRKKELERVITVSTTDPKLYRWDVEFEVIETPVNPMSCSIRLEATDSHGYKSAVNSFIIYY